MKKEFKEAIEDSPNIAAIKDDEGLKKCLTSESRVIFILYGDICNIRGIFDCFFKFFFHRELLHLVYTV
jgi:glycerol uptake operon antiterminator